MHLNIKHSTNIPGNPSLHRKMNSVKLIIELPGGCLYCSRGWSRWSFHRKILRWASSLFVDCRVRKVLELQPHPGSVSSWPVCAPLRRAGKWEGRSTSRGDRREDEGDIYGYHCSRGSLGGERNSGSFRKIKSTSMLFTDF